MSSDRKRLKRRFTLGAGMLVMAVIAGGVVNAITRKRWTLHPLELGVIGVVCAIAMAFAFRNGQS